MIRLGIRLRHREPTLSSVDNLHRVAISNLENQEHSLKRWWHNKYKIPPKPIDDYTAEELYLEHLEDFYAENPKAITEFLQASAKAWDGDLTPEQERQAVERWKRIQKNKPVDLTKYQSEHDKNLTDEMVQQILASVGKDLPGSRQAARRNAKLPTPGNVLGEKPLAGEFEEDFGG